MSASDLGSQFSSADILNWMSAILEDEERSVINWHRVAALSKELKHSIERGDLPGLPDYVNRFIDGWAMRRADPVVGEGQRNEIKAWLGLLESDSHGK